MGYLENFNYKIEGEPHNPKLIFLHGLMGSGRNWQTVVNAFAGHFQILTFDQRGHGRSFQPASGYAPEDYADDLLKIIDELGWDKIVLVGHSMGGRNALNFAYRFSHRTIGLVIEDIGPAPHPKAADRIRRLLAMVPTPFKNRVAARQFFQNEFPQKVGEGEMGATLASYFYMNISDQPDGGADWRFSKDGVLASLDLGNAKDRFFELEGLTMPTLVIRGAQSAELTQPLFEKMLASNPRVQGAVINDAGHWVHFDQTQAFIEVLDSFFRQLPLSGLSFD